MKNIDKTKTGLDTTMSKPVAISLLKMCWCVYTRYCELIDLLSCTRLIVSANKEAMLTIVAFSHFDLSKGIELEKITSVSELSLMRCEAGSLIIACDARALTLFAPCSIIRLAALQMVPAVSIMSSMSTTFLSFTSPMMVMLATTLALARCLWHNTSGASKYFAYELARFAPPTSGEAITISFNLSDWM